MKKQIIFITAVVVITLLSQIYLSNLVLADTPGEQVEKQLGVNPEKLQSPEDIKNEYLKKEWASIIKNYSILGPIHTFLAENSGAKLLEKVLLNEYYTFSLVFIILFILWLFSITIFSDLIKSLGIVKYPLSLLLGLGFAIIFAQIGITKQIVLFLIGLIFSQAKWFMRWIIALLLFLAFAVIYYVNAIIAQKVQKQQWHSLIEKMGQKIKEWDLYKEGLKSGSNVYK